MRITRIVAALALAGLVLGGCYDGRPGHASDRHHGHHGHHDHQH